MGALSLFVEKNSEGKKKNIFAMKVVHSTRSGSLGFLWSLV